jgi:hypothetical protein
MFGVGLGALAHPQNIQLFGNAYKGQTVQLFAHSYITAVKIFDTLVPENHRTAFFLDEHYNLALA